MNLLELWVRGFLRDRKGRPPPGFYSKEEPPVWVQEWPCSSERMQGQEGREWLQPHCPNASYMLLAVFGPETPFLASIKCHRKAMRLRSLGMSLGEAQAGLRRMNTKKVEDYVQHLYVYSVCPCSGKVIFLNEFLAGSLTQLRSHRRMAEPKGTHCSSGLKLLFYWHRRRGHFKTDNSGFWMPWSQACPTTPCNVCFKSLEIRI